MLLYRFVISLVAPLLALALLWRVLRGQESLTDFAQRLGLSRARPLGPVIWIHGASNGELTAARALMADLLEQRPDLNLLITCNTVSARNMVDTWTLGRTTARLAPLDLRWVYARMMRSMDLRAYLLLEADFWPNRIIAARNQGARALLIGGRMSARSFASWHKRPALAAQMMGGFELILAQDSASAQRLSELGGTVQPQLAELKSSYDASTGHTPPDTRGTVWLAASTHDGEDETLIKAHLLARASLPDLKMILAPRHPRRAKDILDIASRHGLTAVLRSAGAEADTPCDIYIADTLGEMGLWYDRAPVCFIAGSLTEKGGHTPFEPAAHHCAIIHGPHTDNFVAPYAALAELGGARLAHDAHSIAEAITDLRDAQTRDVQTQAATRALASGRAHDHVLPAICNVVFQGEGSRHA